MLKGFILSNLPDIYWYSTFRLLYSESLTFNSLNNYNIIYITYLYFQILIPLRIGFLHLSFLPTVICFLLFLDFGLWAHGIHSTPVKHKLRVFVSLPMHSRCSQSRTTLTSGPGISWTRKIVHTRLGPSLCGIISETAHPHRHTFPEWTQENKTYFLV